MNILIIEDSQTIGDLVSRTLSAYGYNTHIHKSSDNIEAMIKGFPLSIIIQNTRLRHTNSIELCKHIRESYPSTVILGIHNTGPWQDRIEFLNSGADDCLNFPFPAAELIARIQALKRRPRTSHQTKLSFGDITIEPTQRKANYLNKMMDLTKKEYQLLEYIVRNQNRTITRTELLDHVWDYTKIISSNTVDVHVQKIRNKMRSIRSGKSAKQKNTNRDDTNYVLKDSIKPRNDTEICTVHGIGYRLEGNSEQKNEKRAVDTRTPPPEL